MVLSQGRRLGAVIYICIKINVCLVQLLPVPLSKRQPRCQVSPECCNKQQSLLIPATVKGRSRQPSVGRCATPRAPQRCPIRLPLYIYREELSSLFLPLLDNSSPGILNCSFVPFDIVNCCLHLFLVSTLVRCDVVRVSFNENSDQRHF